MDINQLFYQYRCLVNFSDKMQRSNYKFVENYLKYQQRKNREGWMDDCVSFLKGAISVQKDLMISIENSVVRFG